MKKGVTYKKAGVDIGAANEAVKRIKKFVKSAKTKNVLAGVGAFGGMYLFEKKYKNPVLVSSIDGVGTKLKLAYWSGNHKTVGQDLVNHCVNDILVQGAMPLFFMDYIGTGKLKPDVVAGVVEGMSKACKKNKFALLGGEMAEMPKIYKKEEYDLAGCIVGVVERGCIVDGKKIKKGDKVIGLKSSGLHTNGYSLAIRVLMDSERARKPKLSKAQLGPISAKQKFGNKKLVNELMKTHISYLEPVKKLMKKVKIKGMAHITGGGLIENIPRILPGKVNVEIDKKTWRVPGIFKLIQKRGNVPEEDMWRTLNMGIGFVVIVGRNQAKKALKTLGKNAVLIGNVVKGRKKVLIE